MSLHAWLPLIFIGGATLPPPLQAGDSGRVHYIGGTASTFHEKSEGRLRLTGEGLLIFETRSGRLAIPFRNINLIEYGQRVKRRYAEAILISPLLLLAKKRSHFVTVGYADAEGNQQAAVFELGKDAVRPLLASLEARTGRRVEYQDEEARKGGWG